MRILCFVCFVFSCLGADNGTLNKIDISGTELNRAALLRVAGLDVGAIVTPASLKSACERLKSTGLFEQVDYDYQAEPDNAGYNLQIRLRPPVNLLAAVIEIPGVPARDVWESLRQTGLFYMNKTPAADAGQKFYIAEIQRVLKAHGAEQVIVASLRTGLIGAASGKRITVVFRPRG